MAAAEAGWSCGWPTWPARRLSTIPPAPPWPRRAARRVPPPCRANVPFPPAARRGARATLARLATAALVGCVAHPVGVEVDIGRGLPAVTVVGLGGTAVLEARDRIRAAFGNAGYEWPDRRITVSLPPADLPKHGSGFDLPNVKHSRAKMVSVIAARGDHGGGTEAGRDIHQDQP
jgi:hypothetical protein